MAKIRWEDSADWDSSQSQTGVNHEPGQYLDSNPSKIQQGYQHKPLKRGLVGWWPLHTTSGVANDLSGNSNNGTHNGTTRGVAGKGGLKATSFDGVDDWIDFGFSTFYTQGTLCYWVRPRDFNERPLVGNGGTGEQSRTKIATSSPYTVKYQRQADGNSIIVTSSTELTLNEWTFVTAQWNESNQFIRIYINAVQEDSATYSEPTPQNGDGWRVARQTRNASGDRFFNGAFADVRLYNRVLSNAEIQTLYEWGSETGLTDRRLHNGNDPGAVARYALNGDATDSWGSSGGTNNGVTFVSDSIRGQSGQFENSDDNSIAFDDSALPSGDADRTIVAWLKPTTNISASDTPQYFFSYGTPDSNNAYCIGYGGGSTSSDNEIRVVGYGKDHPTGITLGLNSWQMVALVHRSSTDETYLNGELGDRKTSTRNTELGQGFIGDFVNPEQGKPFDGLIDDVRIFNRALDPQEVQQLYRWGTKGIDMTEKTVMQ